MKTAGKSRYAPSNKIIAGVKIGERVLITYAEAPRFHSARLKISAIIATSQS
jgi:hypothetical protein